MLIREIMKSGPVSISPFVKLSEAYKVMIEKKIRHLPVVEDEKLIGIVTDRDLRLATSRLAGHQFDPGTEVVNMMSRPVQTTGAYDPVETAVQKMRELKIGCLPVLEDTKLTGIVTVTDLMDALLLLTGIHQPSGRLDIRLPNRFGELARLSSLLAERKININSILSYPEENNNVRLVLRVGSIEIKSLAEAICNAGFQVIWPVNISCVK